MKRIFSWRKGYYPKTISIFLIMVVLMAGMAGCTGGGGGGAVKYDLTMAVAPSGSGTAADLTGGSPYAGGTVVSIKAVAAAGYDFVNWTAPAGGFANADAPETTFTMPAQDVTVTANLVGSYSVTMAVNPVGGGAATDLTNASPYAAGAQVQIRAVAAAGYRFVNWSAPAGTFGSTTSATTTFTMPAQDVTVTASFQAEQVVVFDFVAEASSNNTNWYSGTGTTGKETGEWELTFPGATNNNKGFACYRTNVVLEDNLTYDRVLETHPQWVDNGFIRGWYDGPYYMGYKIQTGDHFYAKVGLIKGAGAGNVTFKVIVTYGEARPWATVAEITDTYDGTLKTIDVDLSPYASDYWSTFGLIVLTNGQANQDWAVWVEAKIIR